MPLFGTPPGRLHRVVFWASPTAEDPQEDPGQDRLGRWPRNAFRPQRRGNWEQESFGCSCDLTLNVAAAAEEEEGRGFVREVPCCEP